MMRPSSMAQYEILRMPTSTATTSMFAKFQTRKYKY
jgi:hypothetical protein